MRFWILALLVACTCTYGWTQTPFGKKVLTIEDLVRWKTIEDPLISPNGRYVCWRQHVEEGDDTLGLWDATSATTRWFARADQAAFSADSRWLAFRLQAPTDSVYAWKKRALSRKKWPKDTLILLELATGFTDTLTGLERFVLPQEYSGWIAVWQQVQVKPDSAHTRKKNGGARLLLRPLVSGLEAIAIDHVTDWVMSEEAPVVLYWTEGDDSLAHRGLWRIDLSHDKPNAQLLFRVAQEEAEVRSLSLSAMGQAAACLIHLDTSGAKAKPWALVVWRQGLDSATIVADTASAFLPADWMISPHEPLRFSPSGDRLVFGMAPRPLLPDTTLLEEEIAQVEVWTWKDPMIYPQQNVRKEREKKRAYEVIYLLDSARFVPLADQAMPELLFAPELQGQWAVGWNEWPYMHRISWEGFPSAKDIYRVHIPSGKRTCIARNVRATPRISPTGRYAVWYQVVDSAWYACNLADGRLRRIAGNELSAFYDELNDRPMHPRPYGIAGWTDDDQRVIIYDRYDLWALDPEGKAKPVRLTFGRAKRMQYRVIDLDARRHALDQELLLHVFDEQHKGSGYAWLTPHNKELRTALFDAHFYFGRHVYKARAAERLLFTKENYQVFPDLQYATTAFTQVQQVSHANPQQADFRWGTVELVRWTSLDGQQLEGLLVKPEDFDPTKKYPLLVNFYERNSHTLHRHRRPYAHRSTINYPLYISKGYVIFNPDIPYKVGYPGQSCYDAVMSGISMLINKGFIDKERIGVQGHSWGGYQVAYLLTKTDLFRCAEAGAPVVNMFSAYGGIRWGSGLSRMFQYEHTQSRIGGTIWQYPLRYLENSPLFFLDRVRTPVLILHNDEDGAVPWYQGIEYYIGLRRLGKPAWLLNYTGEPHWPLKLANRKDFQMRMAQFFDYFLLGAPMPQWMDRGVPAWEKGVRQGLEPVAPKNN